MALQAFERGMQHLDKAYGFLSSPHEFISRKVHLVLAAMQQSASKAACLQGRCSLMSQNATCSAGPAFQRALCTLHTVTTSLHVG